MEIIKGSDGSFSWHVTARNGYKVSGGRGLNSAKACIKGAGATERILYDLFANPKPSGYKDSAGGKK